MSTAPKWGLTTPRWRLALCALGAHKFYYSCAGRDAGRDTLRECYECGRAQERKRYGNFAAGPWRLVR